MKDMTKGHVGGHVLQLSAFIAVTMFFQTMYFLVDMYFVGRISKEAIAGVGVAGNLAMVVLALTQTLGVGATSLIAQSLGRKDQRQAERFFNQALVLSLLVGVAFAIAILMGRRSYVTWLAADAATAELSLQYLNWFVPALALQFVMVAMASALRGLGDVKAPTVIQIATVLINIVLAPVLMFGWGTGHPLGVAGAAIATLVAIAVGACAFVAYFLRAASHLRFRSTDWPPQPRVWWQMLKVGLPVGGEFLLMSAYLILVYDIIRPFGSAAQAGFGIGARLMQSLFLPAVAIGFAAAPVAGQNFGARQHHRVRDTFHAAAAISAVVMLALTLLCRIAPDRMVSLFSADPAVIAFGSEYLRIISWNFVASGMVFVTSSLFQGLGNTLPPLGSSVMRIVLFAVPAYILAQQPDFQMRTVWLISVASVFLQAIVSVSLLHREFLRKLSLSGGVLSRAPMPTLE